MNRKIKALGMAFAAVLVVGAFSAASASAEFHSEVDHTTITASQPTTVDDVFTVKAGTVKCKSATYTGTSTTKTSEDITVTPAYAECTAFGFVSTAIDVNGCTYTFTTTETQQLHILCPEGKAITVTAFNCWVHVGAQTASGITYTNEGSGSARDVTVDASITGMTYTQTSKSFPGCSNGTFTDGKYVGGATVKGTDTNGNPVGIWKT